MSMKTYIFVISIFLGVQLQAQSIAQQVIGSTGTTWSANGITLDFTVGEIAITTLNDNTSILTQGFHQLPYALITIDPVEPILFSLYPNPTSGLVVIEGDNIQQTEIYALSGQKVFQTNDSRFDISHLAAGVYIARIRTLEQTIHKRVVKE